jgi:hypothetical protein
VIRMDASISASWLLHGYFNLSGQDPSRTTTQQIRNELCTALGLPKKSLGIRTFPVGTNWRHTFWWREADVDYAEAQFFAAISQTQPVLSLGISIEKGREDHVRPKAERMDRKTWDWPRLVKNARIVLSTDVVDAANALQQPINLRIRCRKRGGEEEAWTRRTFSFVNGAWFERHVGKVDAAVIATYIGVIDNLADTWAYVEFARDLGPTEAGGLSPADATAILLKFSRLRERLRGRSPGRRVGKLGTSN